MNIKYFEEYLYYENLSIKSKTKEFIVKFINSFNGFEEKKTWTKEYLPKLKTNKHGRIRNELFENIIFPVLLNGYKNKDIFLMIWLVKLSQNYYQNNIIWEKINYKTDLEIIEECYEIEPNNDDVKKIYLELQIRGIDFSIHEWPSGVLYGNNFATKDECKIILKEIKFIKKLDISKKYFKYIKDYENKVNEYIEKIE
jgi:hypothetical protein